MAAKIAIMQTTTMSSINEKPDTFFIDRGIAFMISL
jgi:hypothetical protein